MQTFEPFEADLRGTTLVEASAGTGKTFTITTLVVRLVLEEQLGIDQILVVTFTEAAAAELRERVRSRLLDALLAFDAPDEVDPQLGDFIRGRIQAGHAPQDQQTLAASIRAFDEAAISTIHGFCHRVLADSAFESGVAFDAELVVDDEPMLDEAVRDFWARELYGSDPRFVRWLDDARVTPAKLMTLARLAVSHVDAPVFPAKVDVGSRPDTDAFDRAFAAARKLFNDNVAEIQALLADFEYFSSHTHKPEQLATVLLMLRNYFSDPDPGTTIEVAGMRKLTSDGLLAGTLARYKKGGGRPPTHPLFDALQDLIDAAAPLRGDLEGRELALRVRLVKWLRRELPKRKAAAGVQSFDDLLQRLDAALRGRGGRALAKTIRTRYRAALIDEFQDTDPTQYRIFESIYDGTGLPLLLIGDPKQAIYAFRGADIFAYIRAAKAAGDRRFTMGRNWRSDPALVQAVERLFDVRRPFMLEDVGYVPVVPRPGAEPGLHIDDKPLPAFEVLLQPRDGAEVKYNQIRIDWADATIPEVIAADISRLLASGATVGTGSAQRPLHAGDVAVLVRKNSQAMMVNKALRTLAIPSVVYGDASVFDTREAAELARVLAAVAEPTSSGRLRAAITTELFGVTADALEAMQQLDDDAGGVWAAWVDDLRRWNRIWVERGFVQMFRALLSARGVQQRTLAMLDGERRMTNLLHLAELLHTASKTEHLGPSGLLTWLGHERARRQNYAEAVKLRLERDDRAVQLVTIHRSKGLEYPVVYCPWLWDGTQMFGDEEEFLLWHDPATDHSAQLDVRIKPADRKSRGNDDHISAARRERAAENLRLLYVAVTRARHRCVVVWGPFMRSQTSPLGYLLHSPELDDRWPWDPSQIEAKIKQADDTGLSTWLRARAGEAWNVRRMKVGQTQVWKGETGGEANLRCATPAQNLDDGVRTTSFTHLSSATQRDATNGRDHDEVSHPEPSAAAAPSADAVRIPLADFPRGAKAGNFFHAVLENIDFTADANAIDTVVRDKIPEFGFSASEWAPTVTSALESILATPLLPEGPRLADVPPERRLVELEFLLPLAGGTAGVESAAATRSAVARVFAQHPGGLPAHYPEHLSRLSFAPLRGFLKGFIDLAFVHEGRWYVVDYKTNYLGETHDDYDGPAMHEAMGHAHYVLQYHLYTVALVQHLRRHLPDFDYDRDFGGAAYLFVRGMAPEFGCTRGVFFERPPRARIEGLANALAGGHNAGPRVGDHP